MYTLKVILTQLIPLTCDYRYITSVSLTIPGRISNFKLYCSWVLQPLFYVDMATIIQYT